MKRKGRIALIIIITIIFIAVIITTSLSARVLEKYRTDILQNGVIVEVLEVITPVEYLVKDNDNNEYKVKLLNSKPPSDKTIYEEAKKEAERFILGDKVYLIYDETKLDSTNTPIVLLYYAKANYLINASLIDRGYATYNHEYPCWLKSELTALQKNAKSLGKGMWKSNNVKELENKIEELNEKIQNLSNDLTDDTFKDVEQIKDLEIIELNNDIKDNLSNNTTETMDDNLEKEDINIYIEESSININELEDVIEEESTQSKPIDKTETDDSIYLEDNLNEDTAVIDFEDLLDDENEITEYSIEEIMKDNSYLDLNELLSDKNRNELTENLEEEYFNDVTQQEIEDYNSTSEIEDLAEDWAKVAFSLNLSNFYNSEMDFLETNIFLNDIIGDDINSLVDLNLINNSNSLIGLASDVQQDKPEILLLLYGNFHNIDLVPTDIYEGKEYYKNSEDYSIFVQNENVIILGSDRGVKNYIKNFSNEIEVQSDISKVMQRFSISKPIKELKLEDNDNWLYMDINEELREQIYLITGKTEQVKALSLIYNPMEDIHQFDFTFIADDEDSVKELQLLMTGLKDMVGSLGIASPTFIEIIQGIDFVQNSNMLNFGFSFSNQDLININDELNNPLTLDLDENN